MLTRRLAFTAALFLALPAFAGGCSSAGEESYDATSDGLRTLKADEKIGDIAFGATEDVAYTNKPLYRALHVKAVRGDIMDVWVRGDAPADAVAWIVNAHSTTLASADDSDGTKDAHVVYTVKTGGDLYIVLRDKHQKPGEFHVTLAPKGVAGGPGDGEAGGAGGNGGGGGGAGGAGNAHDGVQNGTETDVDCGGDSLAKCAPSKKCKVDADCTVACSDAKRCVEAPSCRPHFGGDTCGAGEVGSGAEQHESCCRSLEVPGYADPAQPGKKVYLDKYEVTAGRVRAFIEAITAEYGKPDVKAWVTAHPPAIWNPAWTQFLPSDTDADTIALPNTPGQQGNVGTNYSFGSALYVYVHGHNCYQGAGSYGFPTYWYPADVMTNQNGGLPRAATKEELDIKSMTCIPNAMLAAFCAWDGGQLATQAVLDTVTQNGARLPPMASANVTSDSGSVSPNYYYPYFDPGVSHEGVSRIAAPGRVQADALSIDGGEPWMDLRGNLNEVALVGAGGFTLLYQGIGYSSARALNNPNVLKLPEYKAGYSGGRCMRFE
jgi:hypothetical protein